MIVAGSWRRSSRWMQLDDRCGKLRSVESLECSWMIVVGSWGRRVVGVQLLDPPQLPATIVQLHSTTWLTSASRNDRPAAFNDSTDHSFLLRSSSCLLRRDWLLPASNISQYLHDSTYTSYPYWTSSCAHLRLDRTSYWHHSSCWRPKYNHHGLYTHVVIPTINRHFCLSVTSPLFLSFSLAVTTCTH